MNLVDESTIIVNYHFLGIAISGSIIVLAILFGLLYYYYIEKTQLVKYGIFYFLSVLLGLINNSFFVLSKNGEINQYTYNQYAIYNRGILLDYFTVFSLFLVILFFTKATEVYQFRLLLILIAVFSGLGFLTQLQWLFFFIYLYTLTIWSIYYIYTSMRRMENYESIPLLIYVIALIIYYTVLYTTEGTTFSFRFLEWVTSIITTILTVIYFVFRYYRLMTEKDKLYTSLKKDNLTLLYSKSYFIEQLEKTQKGILLFIDINQLKWVNDNYGHTVGDSLLKCFGQQIKEHANENIICSRYGGDELSVLITSLTLEEAQFLSIELLNTFKDCLKKISINHPDRVGLSIGIATFKDYKSQDALINADLAMYDAKNSGNNNINIHI